MGKRNMFVGLDVHKDTIDVLSTAANEPRAAVTSSYRQSGASAPLACCCMLGLVISDAGRARVRTIRSW